MTNSILRRVLYSFLGLGAFAAGMFPFYANFFVEWKPGMLVWFVFGCFIAGLFIGIANYYVMNLVLVSKLKRISQVASAIANKDLSFICNIQSNDTIGVIIQSFNDMAGTLRDLIGRTSELSSRVRRDTNSIRSQVDEIHNNVDDQAARMDEIGNSMQNLAGTIGEITEKSSNAADKANEAGDIARQGVSKAQQSIQGMERIHGSVSSATERVAKLGESSQQIGAIVAVIKEIADQTNLLALNAAIEAARAGEQGRGFAVVADEVRKLAEKTAQATSEISGMIQSIQSETQQAIEAIGQGMQEAESGVGTVRATSDALQQITASFDQVASMVQEIAQATGVQNQAVQNVLHNLGQIDALNRKTLENSEQGVAMAGSLTNEANNLDDAVKAFKLN